MGLLDDAIREHLELKRRRGADPAEIERAEREALGPVRRQPEPIPGSEPDAEQTWPDEGDHVDEPLHDAPAGAHAEAGEFGPGADAGVEPWASDELHRQDPWAEDAGGHGDPLAEEFDHLEAHEPHPAPPPPAADHVGQETVEYHLAPEGEPGRPGEDPLEETPEFLQDAPEHDRLWFEQRPPRDFDFDE